MAKKWLISIMCLIILVSGVFSLSACDSEDGEKSSIELEYRLNSDGKSYSIVEAVEVNEQIPVHIEIPETYKGLPVTAIGDWAFGFCNSLTSVKLPNSLTSIGKFSFAFCRSLESIVIPNGVKSIGEDAFSLCASLKSVTIPNGITFIDAWTFSRCSALESITIPSSVISIGDMAFNYCISLKSIEYNGTVEQWKNISKGAYGNELLNNAVLNGKKN